MLAGPLPPPVSAMPRLLASLVLALGLSLPAAAADLAKLRAAFASVRFIAYSPSAYTDGGLVGRDAIRRDLLILAPDFDGIVTYASDNGSEQVAALARETGIRAVILGVHNPANTTELDTAIRLAREYPEVVVAICVGNEGLISHRYDWPTLKRGLDHVRAALPELPLTTGEPFVIHLEWTPPGFFDAQDFIGVNIHPLFEGWFTPDKLDAGMDYLDAILGKVIARAPGKPVMIKETGVPGQPGGEWSPAVQAGFWTRVERRFPRNGDRAFSAFEAFDAPWKPALIARDFKDYGGTVDPREAYWGFYTVDGEPKPVVGELRAQRRGP